MKSKEKLLERVNYLINLANEVIETRYIPKNKLAKIYFVKVKPYNKFKTASLSFIENLYGKEHPFYTNFISESKNNTLATVKACKGILEAIRDEIENDWLISVKELISAELFSDFLEMAEYLLKEGYKDPAAVLIGGVLEGHLRHLCEINGIGTTIEKNGRIINKKASVMNNELSDAGVYNKLVKSNVESWLKLRNSAAHGKYDEYTKEQVNLMLQGVRNFVSLNSQI